MSNIKLIIEERSASIGSFLVGRLLPFKEKRQVGPFTFIDHMGPATFLENENFDVAPHPHIGLSTLTYLFEGSILHKDSLGTEIEIKPGEVNWMTAGSGIVHSERTPSHLRNKKKTLHGLQIWVALPEHLEDIQPSFSHIEATDLPTWQSDNINFKLIAGEVFNKKSPVPVYSRLYFLEIKSSKEVSTIDIGKSLYGECAIYILKGEIIVENSRFEPKQILVAKETQLCKFELMPNTIIYIFGGEPLKEERFIYWNFVSSNKEKIEEAKTRWRNQQFPKIEGETEFVPLPEPKGFK